MLWSKCKGTQLCIDASKCIHMHLFFMQNPNAYECIWMHPNGFKRIWVLPKNQMHLNAFGCSFLKVHLGFDPNAFGA